MDNDEMKMNNPIDFIIEGYVEHKTFSVMNETYIITK